LKFPFIFLRSYKKGAVLNLQGCKLKDKFELEIALLTIKKEELDNTMTKLWDEMEGLFKITKQKSKLKKISQLQKRQLERVTCCICYESHTVKQLVTTSCGHTFGKCCLSKMFEYNYDNYIENVCPCCRNNNIELTRYVV
jgi:hypothetical protein